MMPSRREVALYSAKQLAEGVSPSRVAKNIAAFLIATQSLRSSELLLNEIKRVLATEYGHVSAEITSAHPLADSLRDHISTLLKPYKMLELDEQIDPDVLGGVIVRTPSEEFDGSLATSINKLKAIDY